MVHWKRHWEFKGCTASRPIDNVRTFTWVTHLQTFNSSIFDLVCDQRQSERFRWSALLLSSRCRPKKKPEMKWGLRGHARQRRRASVVTVATGSRSTDRYEMTSSCISSDVSNPARIGNTPRTGSIEFCENRFSSFCLTSS